MAKLFASEAAVQIANEALHRTSNRGRVTEIRSLTPKTEWELETYRDI